MANTKALSREERKKAKRTSRKKQAPKKPREHARVVAAHHAGANDADAQAGLCRCRSFGTHLSKPRFNANPRRASSTDATFVANAALAARTRFDSKSYTFSGP